MSIHPRIVNGILLGNIGSFRHQLSFYLLAFFLLRLDDVFVLIVKAAAHDEEREDEGDGKESGENTFLPLQKSDMMPVFTPLLSDTPAVVRNSRLACHALSCLPCAIQVPTI